MTGPVPPHDYDDAATDAFAKAQRRVWQYLRMYETGDQDGMRELTGALSPVELQYMLLAATKHGTDYMRLVIPGKYDRVAWYAHQAHQAFQTEEPGSAARRVHVDRLTTTDRPGGRL